MIRLLIIIIALLSIAAVEIPPLHRIVHTEDINSDRVFVSDITYDSLGRRIRQVSGVLDSERKGHRHEQLTQTYTVAIRYAGDSIIHTVIDARDAVTRTWTLIPDTLGHYITAGSHVQYDSAGYITLEADTGYETHIIMRGGDVAERYGWTRYAGTERRYHASYTYYAAYDTRSYGTAGGRPERQHLLRTATYIHASGSHQDTILTEYAYDFGTDGRIFAEKRTERSSSSSHPDYWTTRYTYAD